LQIVIFISSRSWRSLVSSNFCQGSYRWTISTCVFALRCDLDRNDPAQNWDGCGKWSWKIFYWNRNAMRKTL